MRVVGRSLFPQDDRAADPFDPDIKTLRTGSKCVKETCSAHTVAQISSLRLMA
jgi:hypothetical protein